MFAVAKVLGCDKDHAVELLDGAVDKAWDDTCANADTNAYTMWRNTDGSMDKKLFVTPGPEGAYAQLVMMRALQKAGKCLVKIDQILDWQHLSLDGRNPAPANAPGPQRQ